MILQWFDLQVWAGFTVVTPTVYPGDIVTPAVYPDGASWDIEPFRLIMYT